MKPITLFLLALLFFTSARAQSKLTETKEWQDLITNLQNENWQSAHDISSAFLKNIPENQQDGDDAASLRYMCIFSESGLMNDGKVTKKEALKAIIDFKGKAIALPGHPVSLKFAFNSIEMVNEKTDSLHITASNKNATDIFSFEYVVLKDKWSVDDFKNSEGKVYKLAGILSKVDVEGNLLPRFRLIIDNATYTPLEN